ncbi:hypothetical protein RFI_04601 [Reticulomyxa filosa]|uniref:Uncharacterized protein n=1 Tax=Reticulomyxa filosa TaxID=46433 RepID=X6P361_RETFI|nr:hypothetical protein RFI_04601 [Reticulomyxa filosa]|eukprot:ETO32519.1 hypothetical protein RFI_04601 [Reticulomyxa filosa]
MSDVLSNSLLVCFSADDKKFLSNLQDKKSLWKCIWQGGVQYTGLSLKGSAWKDSKGLLNNMVELFDLFFYEKLLFWSFFVVLGKFFNLRKTDNIFVLFLCCSIGNSVTFLKPNYNCFLTQKKKYYFLCFGNICFQFDVYQFTISNSNQNERNTNFIPRISL